MKLIHKKRERLYLSVCVYLIIFLFKSLYILRSYPITFLKESELNGIKTYAFHLPPNVFANYTINPDNYGFCPNGVCLGNGVLNISKCAGGC